MTSDAAGQANGRPVLVGLQRSAPHAQRVEDHVSGAAHETRLVGRSQDQAPVMGPFDFVLCWARKRGPDVGQRLHMSNRKR